MLPTRALVHDLEAKVRETRRGTSHGGDAKGVGFQLRGRSCRRAVVWGIYNHWNPQPFHRPFTIKRSPSPFHHLCQHNAISSNPLNHSKPFLIVKPATSNELHIKMLTSIIAPAAAILAGLAFRATASPVDVKLASRQQNGAGTFTIKLIEFTKDVSAKVSVSDSVGPG